jgi:tetratricopeptide (TPR) repeat protein
MTLTDQLSALESAGLIHLAQTLPEVEYLFRHALVQDAAHASLVKHDRRRLHRSVGVALERLFAERIEELAPLLARHFDEAGDDERSLRYYALAGDHAAQQYANVEALEHYTRALDIAQRGDGRLLHDLFRKRGRVLHSSAEWQAALDNYRDMERLALARGDRSLRLTSLIEQATLHAVYSPLFDPARVVSLSDDGLALARDLGERAAESRILWNLMRVMAMTGRDPQEAVTCGERSLAIARELGLVEQVAYTLNDLQYAYRSATRIEAARAALAEARDLWRDLGNHHMLADNLNQAALIDVYAGRLDSALALADEADRISQPSRNFVQQGLSRFVTGLAHSQRGEMGEALAALNDGLRIGTVIGLGPVRVALGAVYAALDMIDRALELVEASLRSLEGTPLMTLVGPGALGLLARLRLRQGDLTGAGAILSDARAIIGPHINLAQFAGSEDVLFAESELALARQDLAGIDEALAGFVSHHRSADVHGPLPEALYLLGCVRLAERQIGAARSALIDARAEAEAMNARRMLWRILAAHSRIEEQDGDPLTAAALRREARETITYIAGHSGSDELRRTFLNQRDVRAVLEAGGDENAAASA